MSHFLLLSCLLVWRNTWSRLPGAGPPRWCRVSISGDEHRQAPSVRPPRLQTNSCWPSSGKGLQGSQFPGQGSLGLPTSHHPLAISTYTLVLCKRYLEPLPNPFCSPEIHEPSNGELKPYEVWSVQEMLVENRLVSLSLKPSNRKLIKSQHSLLKSLAAQGCWL